MMDKPKTRNSNVEALRIVAMFLILMLHVNFFSIGEPSTEEALCNPLPTFARCFFESVALISVNLFVLISGWFSIHFSISRLVAFVFQSVFIITAIYIIGLAAGYAVIDEMQVKECFFMAKHGWFIIAYIGLMILCPALNYFVEHASKKEYSLLLICFFTFQTLYASTSASSINSGYSTFSFVGLYLLARYVRLYGKALTDKAGLFCVLAFVGYVAWGYIPVVAGVMRVFYMSLPYTNPFNIAFALGVLLLAVRAPKRTNRFVNYVASSTFAVYLCHMCNTWSADLYKSLSISIYNTYSGITYLGVISAFMISVFVASILLDQPRKWLWGRLKSPPPRINLNH